MKFVCYEPSFHGGESRQPGIFLRIGRFGILNSSVPSWLPMIGSRSLPSSWKFLSLIHTFCANSNCRIRLLCHVACIAASVDVLFFASRAATSSSLPEPHFEMHCMTLIAGRSNRCTRLAAMI